MTCDARRNKAESLLRSRGAQEIDHPGGTLFSHLRRVALLLNSWGAQDSVQLAGLCHAVYGTDGFGPALLSIDERPLVVDAIGTDAEALVYLYGSCVREQAYSQLGNPNVALVDRFDGSRRTPAPRELDAFVEITAANELDVLRHNDVLAEQYGADLARTFERARNHLSGPALRAWLSGRHGQLG